ncbi:MAG: PH domain-containing protein [Actinomycetes bacterium]
MTDRPVPRNSGWQRLHPVTPVIRGWKVIAVLLVLYLQQSSDQLFSGSGLPGGDELLVSVGLLVVGALVAAAYSALSWRMTRYRVDDDAVHLHSGVLFRQQRQARLDRLQAVDVVQPLLARLLGLSELRLEVAGGTGSDVRLAYLRESDAQRLRNTLLARAAGVRYDTEDAPEAPEREVLTVPVDRLLASLVRSGTTVGLVLLVVAVLGAVVLVRELGVLAALGPVGLGLVAAYWGRFSREFNFRVAVSPDGVRLRHGLLEQRAQTVPPGRVQAVRLSQPPLWRGPDWWRVQINVAGYGGGADSGQADLSVLLPVGPRGDAVAVLSLVLPDLGVDDAVAAVDDGLSGTTPERGWTVAPPRSRWVDWVSWRRHGYLVTGEALLARRGRWWRQLDVVPHARTQSLGLVQGPVQRRLGLASVVAHSTPGPVTPTVAHLDAGVALRLLMEQAERARRARRSAGPERWMEQPAAPEG